MRSSWVSDDVMGLILAAMLPVNRLAVEVSLATGLRISDVLSLHTDLVRRTQRPYVTDSKTGKTHRIYIPAELGYGVRGRGSVPPNAVMIFDVELLNIEK